MRFAGLAHNTGLYVPELYPDLELAVPADDRAAIEAALADRPRREGDLTTELVEVTSAEVDRDWVGAPFGDGLYRGGLELVSAPRAFYAGAQTTVDVRVTNRSDRVWRWGVDAARDQARLQLASRRSSRVDDAPCARRCRSTSRPARPRSSPSTWCRRSSRAGTSSSSTSSTKECADSA